jgi:hypothetical protein
MLKAMDSKQCILMVLLDLSAAFDTIDHSILLQRLEVMFGIEGSALEWIRSYFANRKQSVYINGSASVSKRLGSGIPQGSVFGPFSFPSYQSRPLAAICNKYGIKFHFYADDSQLYISFKVDNGMLALSKMESCIQEIKAWMLNNFLQLNDDKTEFLVIGSPWMLPKVQDVNSVKIGMCDIPKSSSARNIGIYTDRFLDMADHINHVTRSCYLSLHNISHIRKYITVSATKTLVHCLATSKLDHLNSLYYGIPQYSLDKLQLVQNNAARLITYTKKREHITPVLKDLHWLPIEFRIQYKLLVLIYKCVHNLAPSYLVDMIQTYQPSYHMSLRSSTQNKLDVGKARGKKYGDRAFSSAGPHLWNLLPLDIKNSPSLMTFKSKVKTHLFKAAYHLE